MNFATIHEGIVQNIIEASSKELAERVTGQVCIPYTQENPAVIGLGYDEKTGIFEQPKPVERPKIEPIKE
jgi:hypothetical protein